MKLKKTAALACSAAVLATGVAYASTAVAAPQGTATVAAKHHVKYSDADIVGLLVFAKGRAADDHPDLAAKIRADRTAQTSQVTLTQIAEFTTELKAIDTQFHGNVTIPVQVQDPFQAKQGMERLNDDIKTFLKQHQSPDANSPARSEGWFFHDANVLIELNALGAINAIGYANVAGATEVAIALVVVPSAVSYGFDMSQPNKLDENNLVSAVAAGL
ncbi:hypothetical protein ABZ746_34660 [Streptomyces sp. NPDC020096]